MDCACVYVESDNNGVLIANETRKAKKFHLCSECNRDITPGESYEYVAGKWDGELAVYKTCSESVSIRDAFFCYGFYYTQVLESLHQHLKDMEGAVSATTMDNLTPKAREVVLDMIGEIVDN